VTNPGVVTFPGKGTLLEALALAGGLPVLEKEAFLTKCAIIRGKDKIIWIDLKELLDNGNMGLNARIQNNDVIYIPESEAELAYVMGEVKQPGALRLKGQLTFMDALMMSGGPTREANLKKTYIIRFNGEKGFVKEINLKAMLEKGDMSQNFLLHDNDVVFISQSGISKFNFALEQITPFLEVLQLTTGNLETLGVMREMRMNVWGQEGFVGD
jgi:polysaccharide export outer membrane protein